MHNDLKSSNFQTILRLHLTYPQVMIFNTHTNLITRLSYNKMSFVAQLKPYNKSIFLS